MRGSAFLGVGFLIFGSSLALFGQTNAAPPTAAVAPAGPQPLPTLTVGAKTFEGVTLTGFNGKIVVISHAYGVKDFPVTELTPDQIDALNRTSEKIKIAPPPAPAATTNAPPAAAAAPVSGPSPAGVTNAPPPAAVMSGQFSAAVATNAVAQTAPPPQAPAENPAAVAQAAARTESMIQDFKSVGRSENESEPEEDVPVRGPGVLRFLIWAVCSMASILIIFFLTTAFLRRHARKST